MRPLNFAPAAARVGLVLAVAYLLWGGGAYYGLVSFSLNVLSVGLMAVGLTAWFAWRIRRGRGFARTPLDGAILLGLGAAAVSAVFSLDPGRSAAGVWLGAVWAGVYWVTVDGIAEGLSRRLMGRAIYLSTLVVVCLALGQVIAFWRDWLALGLLPQVSFRVSAPNPTATGLNFLWPLLLAEMVETRRLWLKSLMGLALAGAQRPNVVVLDPFSPAPSAKVILPQLRATGRVARGYIGVHVRNVDADLQRSLGLAVREGAQHHRHDLVAQVWVASPAPFGPQQEHLLFPFGHVVFSVPVLRLRRIGR